MVDHSRRRTLPDVRQDRDVEPAQFPGLSEAELRMLRFALDEAQEIVWSRGGFSDEDQEALDGLKERFGGTGG